MNTEQKVFTVGQVAKVCKVAQRTVSKWFDSGRLKGYRIPGTQDRRIPREYLIEFLNKHGMPVEELVDDKTASEERLQKWLEARVFEIRNAIGSEQPKLLRQACEAWEHVK